MVVRGKGGEGRFGEREREGGDGDHTVAGRRVLKVGRCEALHRIRLRVSDDRDHHPGTRARLDEGLLVMRVATC